MLSEKINEVFNSGHTISFQNSIKRIDGDWDRRIEWTHLLQPGDRVKAKCCWEGFETMEECVDNCLEYINSLK